MRIAVDCRSVFEGCGGIGRYAANLARSLAALGAGHEYLHVLTTREGSEIRIPVGTGAQMRFECGMVDEVFDQIHLPAALARSSVDLYHGTCFSIPVPKTVKWRVATVHDVVFRRHPEFVEPQLADFLDRATQFSVLGADAVLTVSEFSKREIVDLYDAPPGKVHVVPNGVEDRFFQPVEASMVRRVRGKYHLTSRYVLYVGALEEKKGVPMLLRAWRSALDRESGLPHLLVLAGGQGGKPYDVAADVRKEGIAGSVRLLGRCDEDELPALYAGAEVFVYPSAYEGFGLPPLEAMAVGTPTVVSDSSAFPEVVGDAAMTVDVNSEGSIAEALLRLLAKGEEREALTEKGRERARGFTWDECARKTLDVYESLARRD